MHIGKRIAKIRIKNGYSQESLAKGIISASHLSNLENGRYTPTEDVLQLLAERLSVSPDYFKNIAKSNEHIDTQLSEMKDNIYKNTDKALEQCTTLQEIPLALFSLQQERQFYVYASCLYAKRKDIKQGEEIYQFEFLPLIDNAEELSTTVKEFYFYYNAIQNFYKLKYEDSLDCFKKQLSLADENYKLFSYYNLGLTLLKLNQIHEGIKYGKLALNSFFLQNGWYNITKSYNLLGILYRNIDSLSTAQDHFKKGLEIAEIHQLGHAKARLLHNLGITYKMQENYIEGLRCFAHSINIKKRLQQHDIIISYRSIIETYLLQHDISSAEYYCKEADTNFQSDSDYHHLQVLKGEVALKSGSSELYTSSLQKAIKFFVELNQTKYTKEYCEKLGIYYHRIKKYKHAAHYYSIYIDAAEGRIRNAKL